MADKEIKYLTHPVSAAEKKKWTGKGFKIIDARFDPDRKPDSKELADALREIAGMKRPALVQALETYDADTDGNVPDLKARLTEILRDLEQ